MAVPQAGGAGGKGKGSGLIRAKAGMNFDQSIARVKRNWNENGPLTTLLAAVQAIARPILRLRRRLVFAAALDSRNPSTWDPGDRLLVIGPDNMDALPPAVLHSMHAGAAMQDFRGIAKGNRIFVVLRGNCCLHSGYVRLISDYNTHDRKAVLFGELENLPEIRSCETAPNARGKGLYRRVLNEQLRYLETLGHSRVVLHIMAENKPSIRGATAAGFQLCRSLNDWVFLNSLVFQRVTEGQSKLWRVFFQ